MAKSAFLEKELLAEDRQVAETLGDKKEYWDTLIATFEKERDGIDSEWKYYGRAWGWSFLLKYKKKNIVYFTPAKGSVQLSFSFGKKAREVAKESNLPIEILQLIEKSVENTAGHTFDINVNTSEDAELAKRLFDIKINNL